MGSAYGTAKAGSAIAAIGIHNPQLIINSLLPVIMAGILTIYGFIIAVFISISIDPSTGYSLFSGALHMGAGLSVGLCSLASGIAIGIVGDAGVRGYCKQQRLLVGFVMILIFAEVIGLYGLITAVMLHAKARAAQC